MPLLRAGFCNFEIGGDEGDRTPDLCNAIAALQLSYVPENSFSEQFA